tara:strand:+ start:57 stop:209 length:153 start_codon:yes stop_codon:yes gene_type:complete
MIGEAIEIYASGSPTVKLVNIYISYPKITIFALTILLVIGYVSKKIGVVV